MIRLMRLDGTEYFLNAEWIESVEATPDTVIALRGGTRHIVKDGLEDVVGKVIRYQQECRAGLSVAEEAPMGSHSPSG